MLTQTEYQLTRYSHGAGCGCKISPKILNEILTAFPHQEEQNEDLLVGNDLRDDAAVVRVAGGMAIISTTDFFMPIVDDAEDFGQIAAVNAISDVYAMAGTPILAIAILGWPIDKLPAEVAGRVIKGARIACAEAGIPLAGGHSIDSPEPIFGLAVTGQVTIENLKKNSGAKAGDLLYLTKPLGVGILTTARKQGKLKIEHARLAIESMTELNKLGEQLGNHAEVHAMTDVTGFGLAGHLIEMCKGSGLSARIEFDKLPLLNSDALDYYLDEGCVPGGTHRNFDSYGQNISSLTDRQRKIFCDPQTSGGLLVAVAPDFAREFENIAAQSDYHLLPIGRFNEFQNNLVDLS